jgi:hypothetical protein
MTKTGIKKIQVRKVPSFEHFSHQRIQIMKNFPSLFGEHGLVCAIIYLCANKVFFLTNVQTKLCIGIWESILTLIFFHLLHQKRGSLGLIFLSEIILINHFFLFFK